MESVVTNERTMAWLKYFDYAACLVYHMIYSHPENTHRAIMSYLIIKKDTQRIDILYEAFQNRVEPIALYAGATLAKMYDTTSEIPERLNIIATYVHARIDSELVQAHDNKHITAHHLAKNHQLSINKLNLAKQYIEEYINNTIYPFERKDELIHLWAQSKPYQPILLRTITAAALVAVGAGLFVALAPAFGAAAASSIPTMGPAIASVASAARPHFVKVRNTLTRIAEEVAIKSTVMKSMSYLSEKSKDKRNNDKDNRNNTKVSMTGLFGKHN